MRNNFTVLKVDELNNLENLKKYRFWPINSYLLLSQYYKNIMLFDYSYYYKCIENSYNIASEFELFNNNLHRSLIEFLNKRKDQESKETVTMLEKILIKMENCNEVYFFLLEDYNKIYSDMIDFYSSIEDMIVKLAQLISYMKNKYNLLVDNGAEYVQELKKIFKDNINDLVVLFLKDKSYFGQKILRLFLLLKDDENKKNIEELQLLFHSFIEYYETYLEFLKSQLKMKVDNKTKIDLNREKCLSYIKDNENICILIKSYIEG